MRAEDFDHVLAAAADVTGEEEFVVIGSQAIHGTFDAPPTPLLVSMEVDIYPMHLPEAAIQIDGSLGDGSLFHNSFGYYAHGVGPTTAKAPRGWQARLVRREIPTRVAGETAAVAWCLEIHDLVLSKCAAGRDRDWVYATEVLKAGLADSPTLVARARDLPLDETECECIRRRLEALAASPAAARPAVR